MRTSTGSISVTKIIQNTRFLNGKRKYTMAKADSSEIAILPMAMIRALDQADAHHGQGRAPRVAPASVLPPKRAKR